MFALPHPHAPATLTDDLTIWQLYFGLHGRIGRRNYWLHGVLGLMVFSLVAMALLEIAGFRPERAEAIVNLLVAWPAFAISAKRWHDRGNATWWGLLALVPWASRLVALADGWVVVLTGLATITQLIVLLFNGLLPGTRGPNRYGPAPSR